MSKYVLFLFPPYANPKIFYIGFVLWILPFSLFLFWAARFIQYLFQDYTFGSDETFETLILIALNTFVGGFGFQYPFTVLTIGKNSKIIGKEELEKNSVVVIAMFFMCLYFFYFYPNLREEDTMYLIPLFYFFGLINLGCFFFIRWYKETNK